MEDSEMTKYVFRRPGGAIIVLWVIITRNICV